MEEGTVSTLHVIPVKLHFEKQKASKTYSLLFCFVAFCFISDPGGIQIINQYYFHLTLIVFVLY